MLPIGSISKVTCLLINYAESELVACLFRDIAVQTARGHATTPSTVSMSILRRSVSAHFPGSPQRPSRFRASVFAVFDHFTAVFVIGILTRLALMVVFE